MNAHTHCKNDLTVFILLININISKGYLLLEMLNQCLMISKVVNVSDLCPLVFLT